MTIKEFFNKSKEVAKKVLKILLYISIPLLIFYLIAKSGSFDLGSIFKQFNDMKNKIEGLGNAKEKADTVIDEIKTNLSNIGNSEAEVEAKKEVKDTGKDEDAARAELEKAQKSSQELLSKVEDDKAKRDEQAKKFFPD